MPTDANPAAVHRRPPEANGRDRRRRTGHPQQPCPASTACRRAVAPQQDPACRASAAVPQHGSAASAGGSSRALRAGSPQHPPAPATVGAAAGSPAAGVVLMVSLIVALLRRRVGTLVSMTFEFDVSRNQELHAV
jgi:hypothetical protein